MRHEPLDKPPPNCKIFATVIKVLIFLGLCLLRYQLQLQPKVNESPFFNFKIHSTFRPNISLYENLANHEVVSDTFFWLDPIKPAPDRFLCNIGIQRRCFSIETAEVVHLLIAMQILYTPFQDYMPILYNRTLNFVNYEKSIGITTLILEAIRNDVPQQFVATRPNHEPWEIQVVNNENYYKRENLLGVAVKKLEKMNIDYEYLMWIDAHQWFSNPYWWHETILYCEKFTHVQNFQTLVYLHDYNETILTTLSSFNYAAQWSSRREKFMTSYFGNAWAVRRDIFLELGGFADKCLSGFCDGAYCLAGLENETNPGSHYDYPNLYKELAPWVAEARKVFKHQRAMVRGNLFHLEHERVMQYWKILNYTNIFNSRFDYDKDIVKDEDGTVRIVNPMLDSMFKSMTLYTHYHDPMG